MKSQIKVFWVALVTTVLIVGCARVPKMQLPGVQMATTYELGGLYLTTDPNQMTGVAKDMAKLGVGESVVVYARGKSTDGKWFELPADVVVNWKADQELEVSPPTGYVVTVRVVKPITGVSFVTASTTTKAGEKIEAQFTITGK